MKTLILILLPLNIFAQTIGQMLITGTQFAISGGCDAILQADHFYPEQVVKAFPSYELSKDTWQRKYKNGDPAQGEAFLGSTTVLASLTDPFHRLQTLRNVTMVTGAATWAYSTSKSIGYIPVIRDGRRNWFEVVSGREINIKPWWAYVGESVFNYAAFNIGKEITFRYIKSK